MSLEVIMILNAGYEIGENSKIREGTLIYPKTKIGNNFQSGHYVIIREDTVIGDNCSVGTHSEIGHHVKIGNNVRIHSNCFVPEYTEIFSSVWIAPGVIITNCFHPNLSCSKECTKRTRVIIEEGVIIGAGSIILPGLILRKNSFIGAGSLITKNTDEDMAYYGNPAEAHYYKNQLTCKFSDKKSYE